MPRLTILALVLIASTLCTLLFATTKSQPEVQTLGRTPVSFTKNIGQWDERVLFRADAGGATMWFTKEGVTYQLTRRVRSHFSESLKTASGGRTLSANVGQAGMPILPHKGRGTDSTDQLFLTAKFIGANPDPAVIAEGRLEYKCNYFIGNDPNKWYTDVPNYEAITFRHLYPGIDLKYSSDGNGLVAYEFVGVSGADIAQIKIEYEDVEGTSLDTDGRPVVRTRWGEMIAAMKTPANGSLAGTAGFWQLSDRMVGFDASCSNQTEVDGSNRQALGTLTVGLEYSTYLGGGSDDYGKGIAVDGNGNAYVTGYTSTASLPTLNPFQTSQGGYDVFVTKFSGSGSSLVYSTYLGGSIDDYVTSIAVGGGNAYVAGYTLSTNFPTLNPYQTNEAGYDAFVTKLSSAGNSLVYSSYLGGGGIEPFGDSSGQNSIVGVGVIDYANDIAVDSAGNAFVTGVTESSNFPALSPYQDSFQGGFCDAFVVKFSSTGSNLIYSTFFGGANGDYGMSIAVGMNGNAFVTGETWSTDLPTLNAYQSTFQGADDFNGGDVFVAEFSGSGSSLVYSTYLGGTEGDGGSGIAVDSAGNAYVTGFTYSLDFPTLNAYQLASTGFPDAFVTKLNSVGNGLIYSTYLGGSGGDRGYGITIDGGEAYLTGATASTNFPVLRAYDASFNGGVWDGDAFVTRLSKSGKRQIYSTYLGGASDDKGNAIAVDDGGNTYVTGLTPSTDFPTLNLFQADQGGADVFVTKFGAFPSFLCGDANGDESVNISDAVYLIAYIFAGGMPPSPLLVGDANCDLAVNISDAVYLIAYIFASGPIPCAAC